MNTIVKLNLIFSSFLIAIIGCSSGEEAVFKSGNSQIKPKPTLLTGEEKTTLGATANAAAVEATSAEYFFKLESVSGIEICTGEVALQIMTNFSIKFPDAKASCLGGALNIDLAKILSGTSGAGDGPRLIAGLEHNGKVLGVESIMGAKFSPARPMLLGPIVQDRSIYKNYQKTTDHTVTNSAGNTAKGSFTIKVIDNNTTFKNDYVKEIKNVIHWEITSKGFQGMKATDGLIFDKITWWFGTRPIVIPKMVIEAELKDFIEDKMGVNAVVGKLKITIGIKSYK
jgi:hypothetical protein